MEKKIFSVLVFAMFWAMIGGVSADLPPFIEKDSTVPDNLPAILERIEAGEDPSEMNLTSPGDFEADLLENIDQSKFLSDSAPSNTQKTTKSSMSTFGAMESFSLVQAAALQSGPPYTYEWASNLTQPWRYVKLVVTDSTYPQWTIVAELEVYDFSRINIAKGKTATASSIYGSGYEAIKAIDGSTGSWWVATEEINNDWLKIDLGEPTFFSEITVRGYIGYPDYSPRDFTIQVSNDGVTYTTIADVTDNTLVTTSHPIPQISGTVGTFNSPVFDALVPVDWTQISWEEALPAGTDITLKVRTSDDGVTWPDWATIAPVTDSLSSAINLQGRYVEYQASLTSTDPLATPTLGEVSLEYTSNALMVPAYSPKIQDAINAASPGDTVLVAPGTYTESIQMKTGVTVEGVLGPEVTTIEGNGTSFLYATYTVMCADESTIKGFTITGSDRGVWCYYASSNIRQNRITGNGRGIWNDNSSPNIFNNTVSGNGNGIWNNYSSPTIENNRVTGNSFSSWGGGGIINVQSSPLIINNIIANQSHAGIENGGGSPTIIGNEIYGHGFWVFFPSGCRGCGPGSWDFVFGYGIYNQGSRSIITNNKIWLSGSYGISWANSNISNNIIGGNRNAISVAQSSYTTINNNVIAANPGGITCWSSNATITNNIIAYGGTAMYCYYRYLGKYYFPNISNNVFWSINQNYENCGTGTDDIYADPLFVDPATQDFHLQPGSPAIDAGTNDAPGLTEMDYDGNFRIWDGDGDGVKTVDIGAFEYGAPPYVLDEDLDGVPNDIDQCPGTPEGATVDEFGCSDTASEPVDENGGTVSTDTGTVEMDVPQGALPPTPPGEEPTTISIEQNEDLTSATQGSITIQEKVDPTQFEPLSPVYNIEPSGLAFQEDVSLTFMFDASLAVDLNEVELYEYRDGVWVPLGGTIEIVDGVGYITIDISTLNSNFIVLEVYDTDGDGIKDYLDNCPLTPNTDQSDFDGDALGDACDADADDDGVSDDADACLWTPFGSLINADGCSISQLCPADAPYKNHGKYVSCVAQETNAFKDAGLITGKEKGAIVSEAAESDVGKKTKG
jgi:hypothetical protein